MPFFRIKNLPGLQNLVVESRSMKLFRDGGHIGIDTIINDSVVVGDRELKYPLPPDSVLIHPDYLVAIPAFPKEFASDNPFGKLLFEGHLQKADLHIDWVQYTKGVSVTVQERKDKNVRTLYSQNYFGDVATRAMKWITTQVSEDADPDDLVFGLRDLAEGLDPKGE